MKSVIALLIIIAVIGGGYYFLSNPSEPERAVVEEDRDAITNKDKGDVIATDKGEVMTDDEQIVEQSELTIRYTNSGFEPAQAVVSQGTRVTFTNESSRSMWPASAQHPTHAVYSGTSLSEHCSAGTTVVPFDSCQAFGVGESYSFTFEKKGQWGYHNHVNAQHFGSITVE